MFKTLKFNTSLKDVTLIDSHFKTYINADYTIATILDVYMKRNLPVAKNVALYYKWWFHPSDPISPSSFYKDKLIIDREYIVRVKPEINYDEKYFPCVINHIKRFNYNHYK